MEIKEADVRERITDEIEKQGRKLTWLAQTIGVNYNTLYSILVQKTIILSEENKISINKALDTNF